MINIKTQFDQLARETKIKERQTVNLTKQVKILDKSLFNQKHSRTEVREKRNGLSKSVDFKSGMKASEYRDKDGLMHMIGVLKNDLVFIGSKCAVLRRSNSQLKEQIMSEELKSIRINETANKLHKDCVNVNSEIVSDFREEEINTQYYKEVMRQKRMFTDLESVSKQRRTGQKEARNS